MHIKSTHCNVPGAFPTVMAPEKVKESESIENDSHRSSSHYKRHAHNDGHVQEYVGQEYRSHLFLWCRALSCPYHEMIAMITGFT